MRTLISSILKLNAKNGLKLFPINKTAIFNSFWRIPPNYFRYICGPKLKFMATNYIPKVQSRLFSNYSISLVSLLSWLAFSYFGGKGNAAVARAVRTEPQMGQTSKTRQILDFKNREINGSCLCLQRFDKFWIYSARNDLKRKLYEFSETCKKKFVKSVWVNLF